MLVTRSRTLARRLLTNEIKVLQGFPLKGIRSLTSSFVEKVEKRMSGNVWEYVVYSPSEMELPPVVIALLNLSRKEGTHDYPQVIDPQCFLYWRPRDQNKADTRALLTQY